jgi:hypothetical protein
MQDEGRHDEVPETCTGQDESDYARFDVAFLRVLQLQGDERAQLELDLRGQST